MTNLKKLTITLA